MSDPEPRPTRAELDSPGDAWVRPHGNTYWLWPGRLLAGEHPGYAGPEALPTRLDALAAAGVGCFVDLTGPNDPVPVYAPRPVRGRPARRLVYPIADFGVPTVAQMRATLDAIGVALGSGAVVYLHCRAGIGRTGTVAGCFLVEQGFTPAEAQALLMRKWQAMAKRSSEPNTPETEAQRAFIAGWVGPRSPGHR